MATITIVGLGPGPLSLLTKEAGNCFGPTKSFFRTASYPAYDWLHGLGKKVASFDQVYYLPWSSCLDMYNFMATALLKEAAIRENAIYALGFEVAWWAPGRCNVSMAFESTLGLARTTEPSQIWAGPAAM
jgi:uncharacterized protein YabN with tetrapyrrole methylase and pyrophosphatase domain